MTTTDQLADNLAAAGGLPAAWRQAFVSVRREWFIPNRVWIDDGRTAWPDIDGQHCTSSASQPDLVVRTLDALDVGAGQRVLEIGTGTGYNAALLAAQVGAANVTTIEIDPDLAQTAQNALVHNGYPATVLTGDGEAGHPAGAPYDRIIATASIPLGNLPHSWVEQTRPGGIVLAPIRTDFAAGSELVHFVVQPGGIAIGHPAGPVAFMPLRRHPVDPVDLAELATADGPVRASHTRLKPWRVANTWAARWAIGTQPPQTAPSTPCGSPTRRAVPGPPCATPTRPHPGPVCQAGPRNLWDEVETAFRRWKALGKPEPEQSVLPITPHGQQIILAQKIGGEPPA